MCGTTRYSSGLVGQIHLHQTRGRRLRVGLDVWADEPDAPEATFRDPMIHEPGVVGTHHVGALTEQAQRAVAAHERRGHDDALPHRRHAAGWTPEVVRRG